jgi:hypothetical protein
MKWKNFMRRKKTQTEPEYKDIYEEKYIAFLEKVIEDTKRGIVPWELRYCGDRRIGFFGRLEAPGLSAEIMLEGYGDGCRILHADTVGDVISGAESVRALLTRLYLLVDERVWEQKSNATFGFIDAYLRKPPDLPPDERGAPAGEDV